MKKSKNEQVQKFLEEIMMFNDEHYDILQKLREIVFKVYPKTSERMMYGGIMFSLNGDFGGIFVRKNHISHLQQRIKLGHEHPVVEKYR